MLARLSCGFLVLGTLGDHNVFQLLGVIFQRGGRPRRRAVELEQKRDDVEVCLTAEAARRTVWHLLRYRVEHLEERLSAPSNEEFCTAQRRPVVLVPPEIFAMTGRAGLLDQLLPPKDLLPRKDPFRDRLLRGLRVARVH